MLTRRRMFLPSPHRSTHRALAALPFRGRMGADPVQRTLRSMKTRSQSACPSALLALLVVVLGQPRAALHAETRVAADLTPAAVREAILEGRDLFNDLPMPGYMPCTYPH